MTVDPIPYDPTRTALFTPEKRPPIADFSTNWSIEPICAELSRLVYTRFESGAEEEARLADILTNAGFRKPQCFSDSRTGAQALVTSMPDGTILVAFRGTQITSLKDLLSDADLVLEDWPGPGKVHRGFRKAHDALQEPLASAIGNLPAGRLVLTGHSLGAAMATLMAASYPDSILITFGSPRVGNADFVKAFGNRDVRRYADCTDIVSRIPPPILYDHVSEMRFIDHLGRVHSPPPNDGAIAEDRRKGALDYLRKHAWRVWSNVPTRSGADHAPINYVSAVLGRRFGP